MKQYTEKTTPMGWDYIELIENDVVYQIPKDPANSDYQAYLKRDEPQVEHLTEIIPNEAATK